MARTTSQRAGVQVFSRISDLLEFYARTTPAQVAILDSVGAAVTYAELWTRTDIVVQDLRRLGIKATDRVAIVLPRGAENALALVAVAAAAVCVPVDPDFTADELHRYFTNLKLAALITRADTNSASRSVAHTLGIPVLDLSSRPGGRIGSFDLIGTAVGPSVKGGPASAANDAFILLTSGTVARPKMVPLTHASVCLSAYNAGAILSLTPTDRLLNVLPLFHAHGLISGLLAALAAGSSVICTPGFDASSFFGWLRELRPTWYTAVPTIHRALLSLGAHDPQIARPSSLRIIRSASAPLAPATLEGLESLFAVPVIETYGMTEAASQIAANPRDRRKPGSVGLPAGPEIAIMDSEGRPLPSGERGEIMLRGPTITRGYDNDDEGTKSAFRDGWLRTGDVGYLDEDGYLFIVARIKDVINRGGQKVSPLEVEATLLTHPDVVEVGAFGIPHKKLGENVAAVVVLKSHAKTTPSQLRRLARQRLAAYKVPSLIQFVRDIPKSASGKIKRSALASLISAETSTSEIGQEFFSSELESQLADVWAKVLEVEQIGVDQDVFALGADSLAVTQVLSRLREQYSVDLSFSDIFDAPTVAALAARLQSSPTHRGGAMPKWDHSATGESTAPLSFQQQRMYILCKLDQTKYNHNVVEVARLSGRLDVDALESSVRSLCDRHQILRSTFSESEGEPVQRAHRIAPRLEQIKLTRCLDNKRSSTIRREAVKIAQQPFDLETEPPLKVTLLRFTANDHALIVKVHHMATDGWSQRLLWQELAAHYSAVRTRKPATVPRLAFQYRDYAAWQQAWAQTEAAREQLSYWRTQLEGVTTLPLRTDRPRPENWSGRGARHYVKFPRALSGGIKKLSQGQSVTPFMTLLAAFQCLLYRYTGHEDVAIGSLIANRNQIEAEPLIGMFANSVILRTDLSGDPSFCEILRRVRRVTLDAYRNQDLPIEEALRALQVSRRNGSPLFQVMFILQNAAIEAASFPGVSTRHIEIDPEISRCDITLELVETDGQFSGFLEYAIDLFDAATIARMATHLQTLLQSIVAHPDKPVSRLPLLPAAEQRRVLDEWNGVGNDRRWNFSERFDQRVRRTPKAVAVSDGTVQLSYHNLGGRSAAIARRLARHGIGAEMIVALLAKRGPDLLAGMIAIQRVGGAFVCLDPSQPAARLASIIQSASPRLLLTARSCAAKLEEVLADVPIDQQPPRATFEELLANASGSPGKPPRRAPSSLAYVIYTSGSSGAPKGVMIEQRGLSNNLASLVYEFGLSAKDVIAQTAPQSFVISVWQFLAGLAVGARVHICANAVVQDPLLLAQEIHRERVTVLQIVPSLLRIILERANEQTIFRAFSGLRLLISTGEPLPADLCRAWFRHFADVTLVNTYGASESSDDVSLYRLSAAAPPTSIVPVGRPMPNSQLYVLDAHLQPLPIGVVGELCIGGAGVGRGYINDPEQTNARFLRDPFSSRPDARLYRTGDLARWRADGTLECLGRADQQVKIRGYRIELEEIEHVLLDHPAVQAAIVEPRRDANGEVRLIAHIVNEASSQPNANELREFLKTTLPSQAIPSAFLFLDRVPHNAHGKIDRSALFSSSRQENVAADAAGQLRHSTENTLCDIWSDLLKLPEINVSDDFFDLGGHSLLAGRAMARIAQAFGVTLPLRTIFEAPTIAALARRIDEARETRTPKLLPQLLRLEESSPAALSFAQAQMTAAQKEGLKELLERQKRELQNALRKADQDLASLAKQKTRKGKGRNSKPASKQYDRIE